MSQFWYADKTAEDLAAECIKQANGGEIACISSPTIFRFIKKLSPDAKCIQYSFELL